MAHIRVSQYVEDPKHQYSSVRLGDKEYGNAIGAFSIVCTDAYIIDKNSKELFLAPRRSMPASGWWWPIGGRSLMGELPEQSVWRCFKRETRLLIEINRFRLISLHHFFFVDRAQEPINVGCSTATYTFIVELTNEERGKIVFDREEYLEGGSLRAFGREELLDMGGAEGPLHKKFIAGGIITDPVRDLYKDIFG